MMPMLNATYFGYLITIEPSEWGFVAEIEAPGAAARFVASNSSVMRALEKAFDLIDDRLNEATRVPIVNCRVNQSR